MLTRPQPPKPRPKPRMSENATAVIWLKRGTVYLVGHLEISSNSYIERITHMQMLVPCCLTSLLHFKYMSVSSNESDMHAQFKAKAMTFKAKAKATISSPRPRPWRTGPRPVVIGLRPRPNIIGRADRQELMAPECIMCHWPIWTTAHAVQLEDIPLAPVSHTWPTSHSSNYTKLQPISHPTEGRRLSWSEHKQVSNRQARGVQVCE